MGRTGQRIDRSNIGSSLLMGKLKKKFHQTRVYRVPLNSHTIPVSALVTSMAYTPSARVTVKSRVPVRVRESPPQGCVAFQPVVAVDPRAVQLGEYPVRLGRIRAGRPGDSTWDVGLSVDKLHGIYAVRQGDSEIPCAGEGQGAVLIFCPGAVAEFFAL